MLGLTILLVSPLIALAPDFTPPGSCPCQNFPTVTYPFVWVGVGLGFIGLILGILGYQKLRRVAHEPVRTWLLAYIAVAFVVAGIFLMNYFASGSGWSIALYEPQGIYLFVLGVSVGLCTILRIWVPLRSAIMLSVGIILAGFSLFDFVIAKSELELRCNLEVGCNAILAQSTASYLEVMGLILALAGFLIGVGITSSKIITERNSS